MPFFFFLKENDNYLVELFEICIGQYSESSCTVEELVSGERHCRSRFPLKCICGKCFSAQTIQARLLTLPSTKEKETACVMEQYLFFLSVLSQSSSDKGMSRQEC